MSFWLREIAGWALVVLGLLAFWVCYDWLTRTGTPESGMPMVFQALPLVVIGVVLFRGGIHLLKVAVAARLCRDTQDTLAQQRRTPTRPAVQRPAPGRQA
jgi:hypothetical protein